VEGVHLLTMELFEGSGLDVMIPPAGSDHDHGGTSLPCQPMFEMLGTPDASKRLVLLDGGHVPNSVNDLIRAVLDWLDRYLGPVKKSG
jgi:hypothetical protein